jgi:hypothetical protein
MSNLEEKLGGTQPDAGTAQPAAIAPGEGLPSHTAHEQTAPAQLYGYVAEFEDEHDLLHAAQRARQAGFRRIDAYSPIPVEGLSDAIGFKRSFVPLLMLGGGLFGTGGRLWSAVLVARHQLPDQCRRPAAAQRADVHSDHVRDDGSVRCADRRHRHVCAERAAAPYHPLFNVSAFARASQDRFFLAIEARDRLFRPNQTREFLESLNPVAVHEVYP